MDNTTIFLLTVFNYNKGRYRLVGIFLNKDEAEHCVVHNCVDIADDGYYTHAVIEEIKEGVYPTCLNRVFFSFNRESNCFELCDCPNIKLDDLVLIAF
jgi:hypothetical protein